MRCTYFDKKNCLAVPADDSRLQYEPTDEDKKAYCETGIFPSCPRLQAFVEYFQALHAIKRK